MSNLQSPHGPLETLVVKLCHYTLFFKMGRRTALNLERHSVSENHGLYSLAVAAQPFACPACRKLGYYFRATLGCRPPALLRELSGCFILVTVPLHRAGSVDD